MPQHDRLRRTHSAATDPAASRQGATASNAHEAEPSGPTLAPPSLSLPKGGGAIRGIGEKFSANPVTGTGSLTVPIATSPGRAGFELGLALQYDSGGGNGPFGLGWSLSTQAITRKTDKGLPRYDDSDTFILSGAEDLVPVAAPLSDGDEIVQRYRPRVEGPFALIERRCTTDGDVYWVVVTRDNVKSIYGRSTHARIFDPEHPWRIFSWLIEETRDDRGNVVLYKYKEEDLVNVPRTVCFEANRSGDRAPTANRYLKRVLYGNTTPFDATPHLDSALFEVVFDYGEHDVTTPTVDDRQDHPWPCRQDPFSTYRAGFEVRTYRLCRRVLMFHRMAELGSTPCLVRSTDFTYAESPVLTQLVATTHTGYIRDPQTLAYQKKSYPPVEFGYSIPQIQTKIDVVDRESLADLPGGVQGPTHQWVDLEGEGLPGVLIHQAGALFYKRNLGEGRLAPTRVLPTRPSLASSGGDLQLLDLDGDGRREMVVFQQPMAGYHERTDEDGWAPFRAFASQANIDWSDPNLRFIDLSGDGREDVLIACDETFTWYPSLAKGGFDKPISFRKPQDEEKGPALVFADGAQTIFLADMSGDGLTDLVRIRNGSVCYWPNLGYGRFGAKVQMGGVMWFDSPEQFDPRRIRLADVDGSGTTDILYLHREGVRIYTNQAGNTLAPPIQLPSFPDASELSSILAIDLLGTGTACLVWSSPLPGQASRSIRYIDLLGSKKPYLLTFYKNNLGLETRLEYTPSTKLYLADALAGRPWVTRLPFPVHALTRVETYDAISRHRFVSTYAYHHGYFDGVEREFRGFGMVEQRDTEAFEDYVVGVQGVDGTQEPAPELFQPPVTTRTWYHTGALGDQARILHQYLHEYYGQEQHVPEPVLPPGLSAEELRECARALKGMPLRREIYSFDGSPEEQHPYTVTENSFEVRLLQPRDKRRHAVVFPISRETISIHYDRNPSDPRVSHAFVLEVDEYGNARKSCSVVYGRQVTDASLPLEVTRDQQRRYITYVETEYTDDIAQGTSATPYRLRVPFESKSYEITGIAPDAILFGLDEIKTKITGATSIDYDVIADGTTPQKRLLSNSRTLFLDNTLSPLPLGQWDSLGLVHQSFRLAFTPGVTAAHYAGKISDSEFAAAGYVHFGGDDSWWIPSSTAIYPPNPGAHFYLASGSRDALGLEVVATFDQYDLLVEKVEVKQAAWNVTTAVNDYRVLGPVLMTDPNQNRSAVEYDALGMVVKSAVMGKAGSTDGDSLTDPTVRMEYDLFRWMNDRKPTYVHTFAREKHGAANPRWQESYTYSNGSGAVAMVKARARPGKALIVNPDGTTSNVDADPRWVGNGRTILNNKGNPVKRYEPFFSTTPDYEDEEALRTIGSTPILYYDALGRNVRTEFPNGTFALARFDPWKRQLFDPNDTVRESRWYSDRGSPDPAAEPEPIDDPERRSAWLAAKHFDTPSSVHLDSLGRPVYGVTDYGSGKKSAVRSEADLTGRMTSLYDQRGRRVASGFTGMTGTPIYGESAERGRRWTFLNALGAMVRSWDEYGRVFRTEYDVAHRPQAMYAQISGGPEILFNYVVYGDFHPEAVERNLLGVAHQVFDASGVVTVQSIDFKGNPTSVRRELARSYTAAVDWSALASQPDYSSLQAAASAALDPENRFDASSMFDALNRPTQVTLHGGTVMKPAYDEANCLSSLSVQIQGTGPFIEFLKDQDYDAKGQRLSAHYGNDVLVRYFYDPHTFRLVSLVAARSGDSHETDALQSLRYTYDPVGNVVSLSDRAQQTHFFANAVVSPNLSYEYDATYQLIKASGREHASFTNGSIRDSNDLEVVPHLPHPNDDRAVRNYTELYEYDELGNILSLKHVAGVQGSWTRRYHYAYHDDPTNRTNRLVSTSRPGDPDAGPYTARYTHDDYGNMRSVLLTSNPNELTWNFLDQLHQVDLGGGGTAYYVCATSGQRVRKVIERLGMLRVERIYLGAMEIYRERFGDAEPHLERITIHISDNSGRIAQVDVKTRDDENVDPANPLDVPLIRYQLGNLLGSATLEINEAGAVISYEEYHPFGTSAYRSSKSGANLSLKRYRFCGKERDSETGLDYYGARYYASWLGRWISADPAGFADGFCLYRYCRNNPTTLIDPSGRQTMVVQQHRFTGQESFEQIQEMAQHVPGYHLDPNVTAENYRSYWRPGSGPDGAGGVWAVMVPDPERVPSREGVTAVQEAARPTAASTPDPVARTRVGSPRTFDPGKPLKGPYNLWSNEAGGGLKAAADAPGFIMEDTFAEEAAEATARRRGYSGRYDSRLRYGTPDFGEVWHPTSNSLATRAGLSQIGVESHGIDAASIARNPGYDPSGSVQVTREIPRVRRAGGVMSGLGAASGLLTLYASSHVDNRYVRNFGYGAGALEVAGAARYVQGLVMLGRAPGSAAVMSQGALVGRFAGGAGAVVLSTYSLISHIEQENYGVTLGDSAGIVGGGAVLAGSGPVAAIAGGVAVTNVAGDWVESRVTPEYGRTAGVAAGTAAGAALGAGIGAAIGVWFFGVGAAPGAAIGGAVGGIAGFIGSFW